MTIIRIHIYVSGIVQGVFFRKNTRKRALQLGVTGWVRNLLNGRVEAIIEGERKQVETLIQWCKEGPPQAKVTRLDVFPKKPKYDFKTFLIKS